MNIVIYLRRILDFGILAILQVNRKDTAMHGYFHAQSSVITNYQKHLDTTKVYCVLSMLTATNNYPFFIITL